MDNSDENRPSEILKGLDRLIDQVKNGQREACIGGCGAPALTGPRLIPRCRECYMRDGELSQDEREMIIDARHASSMALVYGNIISKRGKNIESKGDGLPVVHTLPPAYRQAVPMDSVRQWAKDKSHLLVIAGPAGSGKTHQACGALRVLAFRGNAVEVAKCMELQRLDRQEIDRLKAVPALLLDDLAARVSPGSLATALEILDHRIDYQLKTIVTTNTTLAELATVDPRLASRLASGATLKMDGGDRRVKMNKRLTL